MNTIRLFLLSLPDIRIVAKQIGLKKTYVNHMKDNAELWNPYLKTVAQFAFAYKMTLSELIVMANKDYYIPPSNSEFDQIIKFELLKDIPDIYSNENIIAAFKHYIELNNIDHLALGSDEKRCFHHFFNNYRIDIYSRTIEDLCRIAKVTPYKFIRTIEAIAYKESLKEKLEELEFWV